MRKQPAVLLAWMLCLFLAHPVQALDQGVEGLRETAKAFAEVARAVSPSVVFIQVERKLAGATTTLPFGEDWPFGDELFKRFFGDRLPAIPRPRPEQRPREQRIAGQGSGFVFPAKDGTRADRAYILTNNHVVEGAERIRVRSQDGRELDARVVGRDPQSDVAVLEIRARDLPPVRLGDSSQLEVGEWVVAIGNPFGLSHTLTVGVVSAKGRTSLGINDYEDFIQTDAAINPGNSGGPLVNLAGEVVGINTAIFSRSGGYMGVGFAIPINLAKTIAEQLLEHGEVIRGYLGVTIQALTAELAESFGLETARGILIAQVAEDSPAAAAGLRQGDVILTYQGEAVSDVGGFRNRVSLTPPGTKAEVKILRDGREKRIEVRIGKLTEDKLAARGPEQRAEELGLSVQTLTPELARQFGVPEGEGVVVTAVEPGSIAALAGLEPGTVILQVNRQPVRNAAELKQAIAAGGGKRALLLVRVNGIQRFIALSW